MTQEILGGVLRGNVKTNGWTAIPWKFLKMLKNYCLNTTIHGLRYFVEEDRHIVERAFWLVCVAVSWVCAVLLVQEAWYAFRYNPINFVVQPAEPGSATPFPSVIICPRDNRPVIKKFAKRYLKTKSKMDIFQFGDALKEVVYFTGRLASYKAVCMKENVFDPESKCFRNNFTHLVYSNTITERHKRIDGLSPVNRKNDTKAPHHDGGGLETNIGLNFLNTVLSRTSTAIPNMELTC
ncbi:uncharacterized protein LOC124805627 [Schistocerca piceifrons]|uniref:uncharacterized protein LOC124805627 n=1 Tax=Schistocerca piceifrons TaxID=274613 RepID=UPI001F5E9009|nr:uncharacterized protein LOC124805627 [Schistocerca piceifrons]